MSRQKYSAKVKAAAALELRRRKFKAFCKQFADDPVRYGVEVFGWNPTPDQEEMAMMSVKNRRVAIMASHGIGKTNVCGILVNHWYDCFDESISYITGPTWEQALGLTFKEVKKYRLGGSIARDWEDPRRLLWDGPLPGIIQETGRILDESKTRAIAHYVKAINAERSEGFQGEHSAPIKIFIEEAVGVPSHIHEGAEGLMTHPDCGIFQVANPTDEATEFGRCTKRATYAVKSVSVFDHPNINLELEAKKPMVIMAVRLRWLYDMLLDHCELANEGDPDSFEFWSLPTIAAALPDPDVPGARHLAVSKNPEAAKWWYKPNAVFEGRALGRFPGQAFEQVIPRKWLEHLPVLTPPADELPELGVDVARHGDDRTVIASRQGPCLLGLRTLRQMDLNVVTQAIRDAVAQCATTERGTYDPKSLSVRIDVTGGLGAGPADTLAAEGYTVEYVNSSEASETTDEAGNLLYPNMRSELWFACRERARKRELDFSRIPADDRLQLIDELATPKWELTTNGRKKVEDKKVTKKKLKWSPDLADAVNLAFKAPTVPAELQDGDLPEWSKPWGRA